MPLYEYECTVCRRHTEKIQKFSDPELTHCPHCNGLLSRVISAPAFSLKGGGWYADGYGSAKPAAAASSEGTAPAAAASATPAPAATPAPSTAAPAASTGSSDKS
jgi:putative FmdB family regulatory protein